MFEATRQIVAKHVHSGYYGRNCVLSLCVSLSFIRLRWSFKVECFIGTLLSFIDDLQWMTKSVYWLEFIQKNVEWNFQWQNHIVQDRRSDGQKWKEKQQKWKKNFRIFVFPLKPLRRNRITSSFPFTVNPLPIFSKGLFIWLLTPNRITYNKKWQIHPRR